MPGNVAKYAPMAAGERLHQGEILGGLVQVRQSLGTIGADAIRIDETSHPFVIVLTQDCDLEQDSTARKVEGEAQANPAVLDDPAYAEKLQKTQKYKLANVLLCEAVTTAELKGNVPPGKDIWKRVVQNKDERYHCIEAASAEQDGIAQGLPSLGCDFKRFFTAPADEVYRRIKLQQITRRCRLLTPYAEHLLHRFFNFQARIPLPENHDVPL